MPIDWYGGRRADTFAAHSLQKFLDHRIKWFKTKYKSKTEAHNMNYNFFISKRDHSYNQLVMIKRFSPKYFAACTYVLDDFSNIDYTLC